MCGSGIWFISCLRIFGVWCISRHLTIGVCLILSLNFILDFILDSGLYYFRLNRLAGEPSRERTGNPTRTVILFLEACVKKVGDAIASGFCLV